jgi:2-dehydro-3-deoxyphosphogluconate aldolase / (4S)-4-hydroxy-2-oxoglutarate aldolase
MDRGSAPAFYIPLHSTLDALIGEPPPSSDRANRGGTRIPLRKEELAEDLREVRLLAAVQGLSEQQLLRAVAALAEGGIRAVELSYAIVRNARQLVHTLKGEGLLVGVGAITRSPQARESGMLGADFIAASVTAPDVVCACKEMEVPCILGALTATEVWRAQEMGADFVKVPAEALGGSHYIRSLREMVPTRHLIGAELPLDGYLSYLEAGVEVLEFKSSLALPELAESEDWAEISRRASNIVDAYDNWRAGRNCPT